MAGKGTTFANDILALIFNGTTITGIADNAASSPLSNFYVALHTADPTAAGSQNTSEATYTSYARVAVARTSGGWTVASATSNPTANIDFPACTGGTSTVTYFSIGTASTGAGKILYVGPLSPTISVSTGVTPRITTASSISES